jgi:ABC-type multidrug transport system fused ATPase/permease subunit
MIGIIITVINKNIINELLANTKAGKISQTFIGLVFFYMIMYFIQRVGGFIRGFGANFHKLNVDMLFHKIFMWKSYNTSQEKFFDHKFMDKYSFISGNTNKISSYIQNLSSLIFMNIGTIVGNMILFAIYEPWLIVYSGIIGISTLILNRYITKKEYELDKKQIAEQRFHNYYKDILTNKKMAKELRIYGLKNYIFEKWLVVYNKLRHERLALSLKRVTLGNINSFVKLILRIVAIVLLLIGVFYKRYDVGTFVLLFGLIGSSASQIDNLINSMISGAYKDTKYLEDYYDFVAPISNEEIKALQKNAGQSDNLPFGSFTKLEARKVSFQYPNSDRKAVNEISFHIRRGEIVSILGYNGSGKTTLSKLLNGSLLPQEGVIMLNNIPVCEGNKTDIFEYFGIAPQEFSRFSVPIKEFVGLGRISCRNMKEELATAYEKAGMTSFIGKYLKGDETVIGKEYEEDGVDLSGGEWQRLIIASAYMGEPEILLMDEPTASIDPLKEMDLIKNFRENLKDKTAILISHRIGFARLADRIIMMQDGRITEEGSHEELLSRGGYYAKLFNEQKKLYEEEIAV